MKVEALLSLARSTTSLGERRAAVDAAMRILTKDDPALERLCRSEVARATGENETQARAAIERMMFVVQRPRDAAVPAPRPVRPARPTPRPRSTSFVDQAKARATRFLDVLLSSEEKAPQRVDPWGAGSGFREIGKK